MVPEGPARYTSNPPQFTEETMTKAVRITLVFSVAVLAAMIFFAVAPAEAKRRLPESQAEIKLSFSPLVEKAAPAVVNIYSRKVVRTRQVIPLFNDPFFRRFFGDQFSGQGRTRERVQKSLGSGVIIDGQGLIITNNHVIEGADQVTVVLSDRREFDAEIALADERTDLAILRVDVKGEDLPFLELSDSDDIKVGDLVLAIGNPFGVGQTVTSGIVSALARTGIGISDFNSFIQTDAAINPGNSGGALLDMDGRLIGINTAIFSKSGGSLGIGFAVPSNMVRTIIASIGKDGRLVRPWLGAAGQTVTADIAASLGQDRPRGVLINDLHPKGSAYKAGIRVGDVVLSVNGHEVNDPRQLRFRIATLPVGERATFSVLRGGRNAELSVNLAAPPEDPPRNAADLKGRHPLSGTRVANLSPALADELGLNTFGEGVIILRIYRDAPAGRLGFRPGDVVRAVNGKAVRSVRNLKRLLSQRAGRWVVTVQRNGETLRLIIGG